MWGTHRAPDGTRAEVFAAVLDLHGGEIKLGEQGKC